MGKNKDMLDKIIPWIITIGASGVFLWAVLALYATYFTTNNFVEIPLPLFLFIQYSIKFLPVTIVLAFVQLFREKEMFIFWVK